MSLFTAGILIIGDEILSGRTQDTNANFIAKNLTSSGIKLEEIRVIQDDKKIIIESVKSFSEKYNIISNTEEIASLWHPPIHSTEAPNIAWLTGRSAPPPPNLPKEGLTLGYCEYRGTKEDVKLQTPDRQRHLYIIGKSGNSGRAAGFHLHYEVHKNKKTVDPLKHFFTGNIK